MFEFVDDQMVAIVNKVVKLSATRAGVARASTQNDNPANTTRKMQGIYTCIK